MTKDEEIARGNTAKRILKEELLHEIFEEHQKRYIMEWTNTPVRDTEGREKLWYLLTALNEVKTALMSYAETGKMAEIELHRKDQEEKATGLKRFNKNLF
jgi:CRISPR/Cas system-associated exonuclease Cas4 (RecB family)|tara:strand:+ start:16 stop:315 length:300 start_codon:yes stop_codon:yes gene_type:complete